MTCRFQQMSFGAQAARDGVRFAFYAPDVDRADLVIEGREPIAMRDEGGWKRAHVADARAGDTYRYRLPDGLLVPDPASRFQPDGVTGPSQVIDPRLYEWKDGAWRGRPWSEAVIYEAHVGAATPEGTYAALGARLGDLASLGVTALQLMPLAQWSGSRNWGYDGVLPFAPSCAYGTPDDLKSLVDRAHALGVMVFIDVVYNHFGPSGNYLNSYARSFFTGRHHTPWGGAINFDDAGREAVRTFFVENALYWLNEYHADGLRFDAVHAIHDDSDRHILAEIAENVRSACAGREVHLILENDLNEARWLERDDDGLRPRLYTAQWNDDSHHCWHTLLTGEADGYYADFADDAPSRLARSLAEGFVYQNDPSKFRDGERRGEPSAHLHPTAFIDFIQNHDQIGNRAFGERIDALSDARKVALAREALLLSPHVPMLFMGEEWAADTPFLYFVDFAAEPELAGAVREGRRSEFSGFAQFASGGVENIPDPNAPETFERSRLDHAQATRPPHAQALAQTRKLLQARREHVAPLIATPFIGSRRDVHGGGLIDVSWRFDAGSLRFIINAGSGPASLDCAGAPVFASEGVEVDDRGARLPAWSLLVLRSAP